MEYYYDLKVFLNKKLYNFYEIKGKPLIIKKIKIKRVRHKVIKDIIDNYVKIKSNQKYLLLCDTYNSLLLELDKDGKELKISNLLLKDDLNVNEISHLLKISNLDYKKIKKRTRTKTITQMKNQKQ